MGVISVPKDTPAKALTSGNMEPDQAIVKPSEPALSNRVAAGRRFG
jgi:hypothetical protein